MHIRLSLALIAALALPLGSPAALHWDEAIRQPEAFYATAEARDLARKVIAHQTDSGGWPKNLDFASAEPSPDHAATIDNGATTTPLRFLARVISAAPEASPGAPPDLRTAFERGVDYLLAAQYPNGGWPQFFPLRKGYYSHITYNDDAMVRALDLLRDAAKGAPPFGFVDTGRRARAATAVERGIDCILRTQVRQNGKLTAWCAQHDERTLAPAWARNFEPPSLSGSESVDVVRTLMAVKNPSPEIVAAIEGAIAWFEKTKITGFRYDRSPGPDGQPDRRLVADPAAPPLWARFYELRSDRPLFVDRDRVPRYDHAAIGRERRAGYAYFTTAPAALLEKDYPAWRARLDAARPSTLQALIDDAAPHAVIRIPAGEHRERLHLRPGRPPLTLRGDPDAAAATIIAFDLHAGLADPDHPADTTKKLGTFRTPTVWIETDDITFENLTVANTAGPVGQALALRADGDRLVFRRCRFLGWQDTVLLNRGRHYFEDSYIEGHVDFIFGGATAFFSRCEIRALANGYLTAASTPEGRPHGFIFADCRVTSPDDDNVKTYLGRPWRAFARTVFLRTEMSAAVRPEGWHNWNKPDVERTAFYAEFASTGPGAASAARVAWSRSLTADEADSLTPAAVLGGADSWRPASAP